MDVLNEWFMYTADTQNTLLNDKQLTDRWWNFASDSWVTQCKYYLHYKYCYYNSQHVASLVQAFFFSVFFDSTDNINIVSPPL